MSYSYPNHKRKIIIIICEKNLFKLSKQNPVTYSNYHGMLIAANTQIATHTVLLCNCPTTMKRKKSHFRTRPHETMQNANRYSNKGKLLCKKDSTTNSIQDTKCHKFEDFGLNPTNNIDSGQSHALTIKLTI